jgi:prophage regulatory protein
VAEPITFLRLPAVLARVGLSRAAVYRLIKARQFPAPRHLGGRVVYWPDTEIHQWQVAQLANASEEPRVKASG